MIRIIHISDFHLNKVHLSDWNEYISDALTSLINYKREIDNNHTFIVCTGDLIDKGGADYGNIQDAFNVFKDHVLCDFVNKCGITMDHIIIVPGNHDIDRSADEDYEHWGLLHKFDKQGPNAINQYTSSIMNGDYKSSKRIVEYKAFEKKLYVDFAHISLANLGASFRYEIDGFKIGFLGLNSAWCSYDDNDKDKGLFIGEPQYNESFSKIDDCDVKILLMHHPLDWLKSESNSIVKWCYKEFNMAFMGHVHTEDTKIESTLKGSLFIDISPSCTSDIRDGYGTFANGVSVITFNPEDKIIDCEYYIYNHQNKTYVFNTELVESGKKRFVIPSHNTEDIMGIMEYAIDYIKQSHIPLIDQSIIAQKASVIKTIKDAFIMPPIRKHGLPLDKHMDIDLTSILKNKNNQLFLGTHESGKTTLLSRLLVETVDSYVHNTIIPIYVDFEAIGNKEFDTIVREYTDCNSKQIKALLESGNILLLVDNYTPSEENKHIVNKLYHFINDYKIQLIATAECELAGSIPPLFIQNNSIAFEYFYIEPLRSSQIKEMMIKWSPEDEFLQRNSKIERMVTNFCSYSLPCTAMSVSLYLWSTENADREPVNQAVLLDIYLEIIMEKLQKENIYRQSFDYRNKTMLLARIAKEMCLNNIYELQYSQYIACIEEYFKSVGFTDYSTRKLGDYFIQQKIFTRNGNNIKFAHSCFYHFYLAQRMMEDTEFKDFVLSEGEYYKYTQTIEYYTGLKRTDKEVLSLLYNRLEKFFEPVQPIYRSVNIDDCFTKIVRNKTFTPVAKEISVKKVRDQKLSQERVEQHLLDYSDQQLSKISDEIIHSSQVTPELLIVLLCNVLRNSEGIEDVNIKQLAYKSIVRNALIWTIIFKNSLARYANEHQGQLPSVYSDVKNVEAFLRYMPFILQYSINRELGTNKLNSVFHSKLLEDRRSNISDIEKYMSIAMYWDNNGQDFFKEIRHLVKNLRNNCVQDYLIAKLLYFYNIRTKDGSNEERECIDIISDLKIKSKKLPKRMKDTIMKKINRDYDIDD